MVYDGFNLSRSTSTSLGNADYDVATSFPVMGIVTFFSTASIQRPDAQRVHIACLVPGEVEERSKEKASVERILSRFNSTGGKETTESAGKGEA